MTVDVDLCNMALAHLGDDANVQSISPPDGSMQAGQCARYYPITLKSLLERHPWNFAMRRDALTLITAAPNAQWAFAYAMPSDCVRMIKVTDVAAADDLMAEYAPDWPTDSTPFATTGQAQRQGVRTPQPFVIETQPDGSSVLFTNQENAMGHWTRMVTDASRFTALFQTALSYLLAAPLAGPIIKGSEGRQVAMEMMKMAQVWITQAIDHDTSQRLVDPSPLVAWVR